MSNLLQENGDALLQETDDFLLLNEAAAAPVALAAGHLHIGKFVTTLPQYTIENEIINYDEIEGGQRPNIVAVDGQEHSWTEYDRTDLNARDYAVNKYYDLPELVTAGAVKQRALEEIETARSSSSPGGEIVGPLVLTVSRMDSIFWIDADGNKYQTRVEGKHVSFNQSMTPFQRATIDTGAIVFCPPEGELAEYIARDLFDRDAQTGLGTALTGGSWVIYQ